MSEQIFDFGFTAVDETELNSYQKATKATESATEIQEKVDIPARQVTCVTFAGDDLEYLIVTSAADGLKDRSENDGDIFIFQPGVKGKEPNRLGSWAE